MRIICVDYLYFSHLMYACRVMYIILCGVFRISFIQLISGFSRWLRLARSPSRRFRFWLFFQIIEEMYTVVFVLALFNFGVLCILNTRYVNCPVDSIVRKFAISFSAPHIIAVHGCSDHASLSLFRADVLLSPVAPKGLLFGILWFMSKSLLRVLPSMYCVILSFWHVVGFVDVSAIHLRPYDLSFAFTPLSPLRGLGGGSCYPSFWWGLPPFLRPGAPVGKMCIFR